MVNGRQVWHFYVPNTDPAAAAAATTKEQPKIAWKSVQEVSSPTNSAVTVYGNTAVVLNDPQHAQIVVPAASGYHDHCTYNYNYTYNYVGGAEQVAAAERAKTEAEAKTKAEAEAKSKAEAEAKAKSEAETKEEAEAIYISEDEVNLDAMLHEQAQALRQLYYFHTVDYGAGDPYGRRYVRN